MTDERSCKVVEFEKIIKENEIRDSAVQREEIANLIRMVLSPSELFRLESSGGKPKKKNQKTVILKFPSADEPQNSVKV